MAVKPISEGHDRVTRSLAMLSAEDVAVDELARRARTATPAGE